MNVKSKVNFRCLYGKTFFISLLFVVVLFSSCFISIFSNGVSPFALGAPDRVVGNEGELRNAVNNAKGPTIIELDNDIKLTETLNIATNKDITLTSSKIVGFYKLIGASHQGTLIVKDGGTLKIDGISVTHLGDEEGSGVTVDSGGTLILYNGEISGNTVSGVSLSVLIGGYSSYGGGVYNSGVFEMYGGKISNNLASIGSGGGVYNSGTFKLFGGEISNNNATSGFSTDSDSRGFGGGVYNMGAFTMSSGKITHNTASLGGGVNNRGTFELSGGEVTNNAASGGGGIYNTHGVFTMSGGTISGNKAYYSGGGVYVHWSSTFDRRDGVISGNTVTKEDGEGKDVYTYSSSSGGSSGGNNGGSGSGDNSSGQSNGNGGESTGGSGTSNDNSFSLREVVIICIGVIGVTLAVVMAVLLFTAKTRWSIEAKM
ncbi:MAG: hypothetical protein FWG55_01175 [Candidatus Bathyarchaeota archaeon]|nr:hypothetical protein [Candidatus Termiticorpusculum sp.]